MVGFVALRVQSSLGWWRCSSFSLEYTSCLLLQKKEWSGKEFPTSACYYCSCSYHIIEPFTIYVCVYIYIYQVRSGDTGRYFLGCEISFLIEGVMWCFRTNTDSMDT